MLLLLSACTNRDALVVLPDDTSAPLLTDFVALLDDDRVQIGEGPGVRIEVRAELDCTECYEVSAEGDTWTVRGGAPLGVQYGLADVLEREGYGFFHPYDTRRPAQFTRPGHVDADRHDPVVGRRGLHIHTLHPVEGLAALWIPNETDEPRRIVDWIVKNRGNHVQWPALDDILDDDATQAAWEAHTAAIVDGAHARGVTVGVGVQLFGTSNLQQAFDLLDTVGTPEEQSAAMDARLAHLSPVKWDLVNLSFGEFFGADPETFLASTNLAYARIQAAMPGVDVPATIHVGNYPDLMVEYEGEEILYYFLVKYADPGILPWVHTVMFYDLYEDAGGAYLHDDFSEHRAFLEDRLAAGEPVGYFPETAYWVAFDNPVPQYLPLYMRSRSLDLERLVPQGLDDQVIFSTGWEWGYWQNDVTSLRMSYAGTSWEDEVGGMFDAPTADAVISLANLQHDALLDGRLAPWLAGRDAVIDAGRNTGIVSQPDRPPYEDIAAYDATDRAAFRATVADGLLALADDEDALVVDPTDAWSAEVADGVEIDALRARFAGNLVGAVLTWADGGDPTAELDAAAAARLTAADVVARRAAAFHDPDGERWTDQSWSNPTIYDYGYLREADTLCFWDREAVQVRNLVSAESEIPPACIF
jgi:hypothetical protein